MGHVIFIIILDDSILSPSFLIKCILSPSCTLVGRAFVVIAGGAGFSTVNYYYYKTRTVSDSAVGRA